MEKAKSRVVRVARIGRPHGIRGEVTVELFTDSPDSRFMTGSSFIVKPESDVVNYLDEVTLEDARWNKNIMLLKFTEVTDRNTAESLRNCELYAEIGETSEGDESWYADELIGLGVYQDHFDSEMLGKVTDLISREAQDLLEIVLNDGREVLLPFVAEIVPEIDVRRKAIIISPPPGLLELNQKS